MKIGVHILGCAINYNRKFFISLIIINAIKFSSAYPQQRYSTFSIIQEVPVGKNNINLITSDFNGDGIEDILSFGIRNLTMLYSMEDSLDWKVKQYVLEAPIKSCAAADLNNDNNSDLAVLFNDPAFLKIYLSKHQDTIVYKWKYNLSQIYDVIQVDDINGDGRKDILLYGKSVVGISVLLGNGDGTFKYPQTILSDYSFSSVSVFDFQGDNLPDLLTINWITNEIQLFTAYARLRYSLPASLIFNDEPSFVFPANIDKDENIDLVITFKEKPFLETYLGDGLGNFIKFQKLNLLMPADKILKADIHNTGSIELVILNREKKYLSLWMKDKEGLFVERTIFSAGKQPSDFVLFRHKNSEFHNIAISSQIENKLSLIQNSHIPIEKTKTLKYVTGLEPSAIKTLDLMNNGLKDIVVSNKGSRSISLFINTGGVFDGQINFHTAAENPISLDILKSDADRFLTITSHNNSSQISISDIKLSDYSYSTYTITSIGLPIIFDFNLIKPKSLLNFKVATIDEDEYFIRLFEFNQIAKAKYTEQEFTKSISKQIVGITAHDINKDGIKDYVYIKAQNNNTYQLTIAYSDNQNRIVDEKYYFTYRDTINEKLTILLKDLNNNNRDDIIIYSPSNQELILSKNINDTSYSKPYQRIKNIKLNNTEDIQFIDIDDDKNIDMIIANAHTRTLQAYFGRGDGSFLPQKRLMSIEGVSGIAVSDFDKDDIPDYALVYEKEGYVKIIYGQR